MLDLQGISSFQCDLRLLCLFPKVLFFWFEVERLSLQIGDRFYPALETEPTIISVGEVVESLELPGILGDGGEGGFG